MKMNKFTLLLMIIIGAVLFSACNKEDPAAKEKKDKVAENEANVKAVVKAISDSEVRFPVFIDDEGHIGVVATDALIDGTTYGFDNPKTGTSVYAFAAKKGLNEEQASAIWELLSPKELSDIPKQYPDDFSVYFPYKGADIDYVTLSNVETKPADGENNNLQITADLTVHLHLVDGTEKTEVYEVSKVPDIGDTPLREIELKNALSADKMNEELPNEERSFYKERGADSDE